MSNNGVSHHNDHKQPHTRESTPDSAMQEILQERARALAKGEDLQEELQGEDVVTFQLGQGNYSIPTQFIREVYPLQSFTPLPSTPPFIIGLVNVRGRLLTVIDLRPLLQLEYSPPLPNSFLLIISAAGTELGLLADSVTEVRHSALELTPALSAAAGYGTTWVRGIDPDLNLVLDPPALVVDPRLTIDYDDA